MLLADEIDSFVGDAPISVLRQLYSRYPLRPRSFPQSVVLRGVRDLRYCLIRSGSTGDVVLSGSAFNISAKSLRVGDRSRMEVADLLRQYTAETGRTFSAEATEHLWVRMQGQPWLVYALCHRSCFRRPVGKGRKRSVPTEDLIKAEQLSSLGRSCSWTS